MNGYFQLINGEGQTKVCLYPPIGDGAPLDMNEVVDYLNFNEVVFSIPPLYSAAKKLKKEPVEVLLSRTETAGIDEYCRVRVARDSMSATIRFYAPSTEGRSLKKKDITNELSHRGIRMGILEDVLSDILVSREYCRDYTIALGRDTVQGKDGFIEYLFEENCMEKPDLLPDGSVDLKHLLRANFCQKGDVLARLNPPSEALCGYTVKGEEFPGEPGKPRKLRAGSNVSIGADGIDFTAMIGGNVRLEKDKVAVYPVLEPTRDNYIDNELSYEGSVFIDGDVRGGVRIKASGNIIINGEVQDSYIDAGGDIVISRPMDGRGRGSLRARGSILGASFVNVKLYAGRSVHGDVILKSTVMAGDSIRVWGPRGIISGGMVSARNGIFAKVLGSDDGKLTIAEAGCDPSLKQEIDSLETEIADREQKMQEAYPVLTEATAKIAAGEAISPEQLKGIKELHSLYNGQKKAQKKDRLRLAELREKLSLSRSARVMVGVVAHAGTHISIGEFNLELESRYEAGIFIKERDRVKYEPEQAP